MKLFNFSKKKTSHISEAITFDPEKQIAVLRCSICTGEQVAGFRNKEDGSLTEITVIRSDKDLEDFKKRYNIENIKKEY